MREFTPHEPTEKEYPELDQELARQLDAIEPSHSDGVKYFPCMVTLDNNRVVENVFVTNAQEYIDIWGVWPDEDSGKSEIDIGRIVKIQNSPNRLPSNIADKIYTAGESGMGYCVFTVLFKDGSRQAYVTGNAVDFIKYPRGKSAIDIEDVIMHEGRDKADENSCIEYYWCLYGKGKPSWGA